MGVLRPRHLTIAAADFAGAVSVAIILIPSLKFAYRSQSSHIMLETATAMIAVIAAVLVWGRFKNSGSMSDLLLLVGLCFFSLPKFIVPYIGDAFAADTSRFSAWAMLVASVVGSALFTYAAFLPERRLAHPRQEAAVVGLVSVAGAIAIGAILAANSTMLQLGLDPSVSNASYPKFAAPGIVSFQLIGLVFFGLAAIGFTNKAEWTGDEFTSWLGASAALSSFSRLNYVFFPSLHTEWVYPADILRLTAYLLILFGAAREIRRNQQGLARAAILDERRRMARELHDGLAQELAFIVTRTRELAEGLVETNSQSLRRLCAAGERALDESRRAITALSAPMDESFESAVVQTVEEVASRAGTRTDIVVDPEIDVPASMKEALLRVLREAVANASRHGGATRVHVEVRNGDGLRLLIRDDGSGFDTELVERESDGYGLTTMAERVHALGGELRISSQPEAGTEVEVVVP
jgi:signal transduction histidine kinase